MNNRLSARTVALFLVIFLTIVASEDLPSSATPGSLAVSSPEQAETPNLSGNSSLSDSSQSPVSDYSLQQQLSLNDNEHGDTDNSQKDDVDNPGRDGLLPTVSTATVGSDNTTDKVDDRPSVSDDDSLVAVPSQTQTGANDRVEITDDSNKDITKSGGMLNSENDQRKNNVIIDNQENKPQNKSSQSVVSTSNTTHIEVDGNVPPINYSWPLQAEEFPMKDLPSLMPSNALLQPYQPQGASREQLTEQHSPKLSVLLPTSSKQEEPSELPKLALYQSTPKEHEQKQEQPLEIPKLPQYQSTLDEQYEHKQEQPLELSKLSQYQSTSDEQEGRKEQLFELHKPPQYQSTTDEKQQKQGQPLELPILPQYHFPSDEQEEQPLELPKLPQYQPTPDEHKEQPLEFPKLPQYQPTPDEHKEEQPLELPQLPQYQPTPVEHKEEQPLELPQLPQYQPTPDEHKEEQPLELPKLPQYEPTPVERKEEQPLELPKLPQYQPTPDERKEEQPLELPKLQYQPTPDERKEEQPLELPKLPQYQPTPDEHKEEQPLELPQLPQYQPTPDEHKEEQPLELPQLPEYQPTPDEHKQEQPLELPKLPQYQPTSDEHKEEQALEELPQLPQKETSVEDEQLERYEQNLLEQMNGARHSDNNGSSMYTNVDGILKLSDNPKDHAHSEAEASKPSDYDSPWHDTLRDSPVREQTGTDNRQTTKLKSFYQNLGQDGWYKEDTNNEGYYDHDENNEDFKGNNLDTDDNNSDDEYMHEKDEEDEHGDVKAHLGEDDQSDTAWDAGSDQPDQDDFDSERNHLVEDVVDEDLVMKNRIPTAPTSMVLLYTWLIVAVLIFVVGISMYQSRCHGFRFRFPGSKSVSSGSDRKRLLDHEFV